MLNSVCTKCDIEKPETAFRLSRKKPDVLRHTCRDCEAAYQRSRYAANREVWSERKRLWMARLRSTLEGREQMKAISRRCWWNGGRERNQAQLQKLKANHFFEWRARNWSTHYRVRVSARDLASLWKQQRGRCALSGRRLDRRANLDHIVPQASGGTHDLTNLRWTDPQVNMARGSMSDREFMDFSAQICGMDRAPNPRSGRAGSMTESPWTALAREYSNECKILQPHSIEALARFAERVAAAQRERDIDELRVEESVMAMTVEDALTQAKALLAHVKYYEPVGIDHILETLVEVCERQREALEQIAAWGQSTPAERVRFPFELVHELTRREVNSR